MQQSVSSEAVNTAADHLRAADPRVGSLIAAADANLQLAAKEARANDYSELQSFLAQMPIWVRDLNSEQEKLFWVRVVEQTSSLVDRIRSREIKGHDTAFENLPLPENVKTSAHKSWADYESSSDEEEDVDYLYGHVHAAVIPSGLIIPEDLDTVWPKGYAILVQASKTFSFDLVKSDLSLARAGLKGAAALSENKTEAQEAFERLNQDEQRAINLLKSLFIFMKLEPDRTLASDPKFALSASFALHFLLRTEDAETNAKIAKSLKHEDGGKSLLIAKLSLLFQTDIMVLHILMTTVEKVYRALARSRQNAPGGISKEMHNLILKFCFTSPEGMLEHYYTRERREVTKLVEKVDARGKLKKVPEKRLVSGFRVPSLLLGDDLLKPEEKNRLKTFEHRYNMPKLAKTLGAKVLEQTEDPLEITGSIEQLVRKAYALTTLISSVIKQRRKKVRAEASKLLVAPATKITQASWLAESEKVLAASASLPESTYEEIENFLKTFET